jgi:hypothetical protein
MGIGLLSPRLSVLIGHVIGELSHPTTKTFPQGRVGFYLPGQRSKVR